MHMPACIYVLMIMHNALLSLLAQLHQASLAEKRCKTANNATHNEHEDNCPCFELVHLHSNHHPAKFSHQHSNILVMGGAAF